MPLYLATFGWPVHGNVAAGLEGLVGRESMEDAVGDGEGALPIGMRSPSRNRLGSLREDFVSQGQHGNEQQADERPDHLVQGVHLRPQTGDLGLQLGPDLGDLGLQLGPEIVDLSLHFRLETIDLSLHFGPETIDLSLHLRPELGDLSLQLGPDHGDLGSDGGDDVLPTQVTHLLDGGMDQLGVRAAVDQDPMNGAGFRLGRGRHPFSPFPDGVISLTQPTETIRFKEGEKYVRAGTDRHRRRHAVNSIPRRA